MAVWTPAYAASWLRSAAVVFAVKRHLADRQVHGKRRAVLAPRRHFATDADDASLTRSDVPVDVAVVLIAIRRRHQDVDGLADDLRSLVAEQPLRARVEGLRRSREHR
jgi:hypothetical protein